MAIENSRCASMISALVVPVAAAFHARLTVAGAREIEILHREMPHRSKRSIIP